jgi:hypothetical protein
MTVATGFDFEPLPDGNVLIEVFWKRRPDIQQAGGYGERDSQYGPGIGPDRHGDEEGAGGRQGDLQHIVTRYGVAQEGP